MNNIKIFANFKSRLIAHIIDIIILSLSVFFLSICMNSIPEVHIPILQEISYLILSSLYYTIFTASRKAGTIGKQIMKIKIVDHHGQILSLQHAFGRYLAYYFSYLTLGFGFLMILLTRKKISLHDKIANTYVIGSQYEL